MVQVKAYLAPLNASIDTDNQVKELQNQIKEKDTTISNLTNEVDFLNEQLEELQDEVDESYATITEKNNEIAILTEDKLTLQNQLDEANERITNQSNLILENGNTITQLNTQLNTANNSIEQLTAQVAQLQEQLENTADTEELNKAKEQIKELNNTIAIITNDKEELETQVTNLNTTITGMNEYQSELQNQITGLEHDKTTLQSQLNTANNSIEQLNTQVSQLQEQLENAVNSEELEQALAQIQELNTTITGLEEDKNTLQSQLEIALQESISTVFEELVPSTSIAAYFSYTGYPNRANRANALFSGTGYILGISFEVLGMKNTYNQLNYNSDNLERPTPGETYDTSTVKTIELKSINFAGATFYLHLMKAEDLNNKVLEIGCTSSNTRLTTGVFFLTSPGITMQRY